jgi:hypothetical protein
MRRAALTAVAGLFIVACQELSTTPTADLQDHQVAGAVGGTAPGNPPPPPIDSGAVGIAENTETGEGSTSVVFRVTYMLNKPENSGWLKFNKDEFSNTDVDNSAAIKMLGGVFSGKGTLRIAGTGGTFFFNLASQDFGGRAAIAAFGECTEKTEATITTTEGPNCFALNLAGTFVPTGGGSQTARLTLIPGKTQSVVCTGEVFNDECFISSQ